MRNNIPALTGIRGLAALMLVLFHLPLQHIFQLGFKISFIENAFFGVDLFFILSGFILMHVHADDFKQVQAISLRTFFITRFFRIYPLHVIVLLAILGFVSLAPQYVAWVRSLPGQSNAYHWSGFFQTLTLTNAIGLPPMGVWNAPTWSLSVEAVGYALFPVLALGIGKIKKIEPCLIAAFVLLFGFSQAFFTVSVGHYLLRMAWCFTSGMLIARAYHLKPTQSFGKPLATLSACWAIVALSIDELSVFCVFGFAGLIYALALGGGVVERFLASRAMLFLGRISFSLYISHYTVITALLWAFWGGDGSTAHPVMTTILLVGVAVGVAIVLYYVVERPSHRLGRQLAQRDRRVPSIRSVPDGHNLGRDLT